MLEIRLGEISLGMSMRNGSMPGDQGGFQMSPVSLDALGVNRPPREVLGVVDPTMAHGVRLERWSS